MTYNFDADRWYENELRALDMRLKKSEIKTADYKNALKDLDERYDRMIERLDNTYQIPEQCPSRITK